MVVLIEQVEGFVDDENSVNYQCFFRLNKKENVKQCRRKSCFSDDGLGIIFYISA